MEALDLIGLAVIESWPSFTSGAEHSKVAVSCLSDEAVDFIKTLFDGEHNEQTTVNIETELEETEIPLCSSPISFISFLYLDENSKANTDETPELGIYFPSECNFAERQQMAELSEPVLQVPSESLVCLVRHNDTHVAVSQSSSFRESYLGLLLIRRMRWVLTE